MSKYYSVKELADWCGVSKTTIQRTINELEIKFRRDKNRHLYSEEDCQLICRKLNRKPIETEPQTADETEQNKTTQNAKNQTKTETKSNQNENDETKRNETELTKDEFIKYLKGEIEKKNEQIQNQSEEIKMLIMTNANLVKQIEEVKQPQQLVESVEAEVIEETDKPIEEENQPKKWWKFW